MKSNINTNSQQEHHFLWIGPEVSKESFRRQFLKYGAISVVPQAEAYFKTDKTSASLSPNFSWIIFTMSFLDAAKYSEIQNSSELKG